MTTSLALSDNIVTTHFSGSVAGTTNLPSLSSGVKTEYRVVHGKGPAPLEMGDNLQKVAALFSAAELAEARVAIAEEALAEKQAITVALLRMRVGLSQKELAENLGTSQSRVSRIESGREEPGFRFLARMREVLGCTLEELFSALGTVRE